MNRTQEVAAQGEHHVVSVVSNQASGFHEKYYFLIACVVSGAGKGATTPPIDIDCSKEARDATYRGFIGAETYRIQGSNGRMCQKTRGFTK
jgi:hypothetical protein